MIQTAFQIGAFQFTAFQEGRAVGGGAQRRYILGRALARAKHIKESPTPEEVAEILVEARARTRLFLRPVPYVVTDLSALAQELRRRDDEQELERFKAIVRALAEEWDEAA